MKKSILLLITIIGTALLCSSCAQTKGIQSKATDRDIGTVIYVKNDDGSGNLIANWAYSANDTTTVVGTGYTTKAPNSKKFEGKYKIYYTGTSVDSFNLIINRKKSINNAFYYSIEWQDINTGFIDYYGTGIVKNNQLIAGWRK